MSPKCAEVLEILKPLSLDEKRDLMEQVKRYVIEERRQEILDNCIQARKEYASGELKHASDTDTFMAMLDAEQVGHS